MRHWRQGALWGTAILLLMASVPELFASSHREAPLISNDPLADNTDLYAFRSPDNPGTVTIIANWIPFELPEGGPNYYSFGENIRYEIHIKNRPSVGELGDAMDDITYRFTFTKENEDPTTFFNIRLGKENLKTSYTVEKSTDGGATFTVILQNGIVPPANIGPRSIEGAAGLNTTYDQLVADAIMTANSGEKIFAGPRDDPFFVDLGGIFDLGQTRSEYGSDPSNSNNARDGLAGFNTHSIVLQIPIASLQKDGKPANQASSILDPDFVIGVWASASRPRVTTLSTQGEKPMYSDDYVQVSRLGNPLVNEAIIPIEYKDKWNSGTPYSIDEPFYAQFFTNPELALYMDDSQFGGAVPALAALRVPSMSYPALGDIDGNGMAGLDFRNGHDGAFELTKLPELPDLSGTAFEVPLSPGLLAEGEPRTVDIMPIFYFGVPNLPPYQLATGKTGGPLSAGKPFIHNFLPVTVTPGGTIYGGDMLRLNMATPPTPRNDAEYRNNARMGLIRAAAIGLTATPFNQSTNLESIPHMDGYPNGRRLEDDVTTISLQAVGGLVLAAVGLPFDDAVEGTYSDLASPMLLAALTYNAGPTENDVDFLSSFPYVAPPHRGYDYVKDLTADAPPSTSSVDDNPIRSAIGMSPRAGGFIGTSVPNPVTSNGSIEFHLNVPGAVVVNLYDAGGRKVSTLMNGTLDRGTHRIDWRPADGTAPGTYMAELNVDGHRVDVAKISVAK